MIPLILSIASSTVIFVIFKLFDRFKIDTFQAIVVNYFTAFVIGIGLYQHEWHPEAMSDPNWIFFSVLTAFLFISLFFLMGKSAQINGVSSTSIAVKMSMIVSILLMVILYKEPLGFLKLLGVSLAFGGVYLVSSKSKSSSKSQAIWMLIILFIGSGALDFTLNYVQEHVLLRMTVSIYSALSLGMAGILGVIIIAIRLFQGKMKLAPKNILAGILLGIPNYFSIYLLMLSYHTTGWTDSTVLTVTNVSVVLASSLIGFLAFQEKSSAKKQLGLLTAIAAIVVLYFAS